MILACMRAAQRYRHPVHMDNKNIMQILIQRQNKNCDQEERTPPDIVREYYLNKELNGVNKKQPSVFRTLKDKRVLNDSLQIGGQSNSCDCHDQSVVELCDIKGFIKRENTEEHNSERPKKPLGTKV